MFGFLLLALYIDPTGIVRLNPFGGEECAPYEQQRALSQKQETHDRLCGGKSREASAEGNARNATTGAPDQQNNQADYYACRLAVYG
jgi:hypothetical protein